MMHSPINISYTVLNFFPSDFPNRPDDGSIY